MYYYQKLINVFCLTMFVITTGLYAGEIHEAAAAGDLDKVKTFLKADPTLLDSRDDMGNTPLISACWGPPSNTPQVEVANFLINMGANINARNNNGGTPLYFAVKNPDLTKFLISKGAEVNIKAYNDLTPLHRTVFSGNYEVAKLLVAHGADINARSLYGNLLHWIIIFKSESNVEIAKLLVENGIKLNQEFSFGNTELHLAAIMGLADLVEVLIKHGANVNALNDYNHTALYYAARHGYQSVADILIAAGADKNTIVESNYGKAPQLTETLKQGEAYLWYLGGNTSPSTGYAVKTKEHVLVFNPSDINESLEAGLANGYLNPAELAGQNIIALITFKTYYGQYGNSVSELSKQLPGTSFVLNFKPDVNDDNNNDISYKLANPNESFSINGIKVHTIPAMRQAWFGDEGLGYLVEADGVKVFYPGLHAPGSNEASEIEKYHKEIDFLKPFAPVDIIILPITGRHINFIYEHYLYLIDQLVPKAIYLIGDDLVYEEHRKCLEVLSARDVPVFYPDGGIALGQRFHYLRD